MTQPIKTPAPQQSFKDRGIYNGAELKPFEGRPGAMDAYKLPSMRGGRRVEPSLYMRDTEGEAK